MTANFCKDKCVRINRILMRSAILNYNSDSWSGRSMVCFDSLKSFREVEARCVVMAVVDVASCLC